MKKAGGAYETQNQTSFIFAAVADDADGGAAYVDMGGRKTEFSQATGAEAELPNEPEETAEPELPVESPEATSEPELPSEPTELPSETETPEGTAEPTPQVTEEPMPTPEPEAAYQAGVFVLVTENTRVFSDVDETADEADGELYDGSFVRTANVRVEEVRQDGMGRTWLLVRYLYGEGRTRWRDGVDGHGDGLGAGRGNPAVRCVRL